MPMPKKQPDENRKQFIDRCMANPTMVKEFPDIAQRQAICEKQSQAQADAAPLNFISEPGGLIIEAAADSGASENGKPRLPRFTMTAYTGGSMRPYGWRYPVVVDMAGMNISSQSRPIRFNHDSSGGIGHTDAIYIQDGRLIATGVVSRDTPEAKEVVAAARNGFPWQASVGLSVDQHEFVKEGQSVLVNGREFTGPVNVLRKTTLGEISFVDLGADGNTSANVAASANNNLSEEKDMDPKFKAWLEAKGFGSEPEKMTEEQTKFLKATYDAESAEAEPKKISAGAVRDVDSVLASAKAERERSRQISAIIEEAASIKGADLDALDTLSAKAIAEGMAVKDLELAVLRLTRPRAPAVGRSQSAPTPAVLEAAALMSVGHSGDSILKSHGEQAVEAADRMYGQTMGLQELILSCAKANGYAGRDKITAGNWRQFIDIGTGRLEAAGGFSTVSLPGILGNVANKALAAMAAEPMWLVPKLCGVVSHTNFHAHTVYSLAMNGELLPVGPSGELKHLSLTSESYQRQLGTRGAVLRLSRTDVINDDLGVFSRNAAGLARKAYTTREKVLFTAICATGAGASFFTAARGNYLTGAATAFGPAAMALAIAAFRGLKGPDGDPVMVEPALCLVPPTLEDEARRLLAPGGLTIIAGPITAAATRTRDTSANIYAGRFGGVPLVSPWLENAMLTGHSTAYWYLFADPAVYPAFEIAYLNGAQTPTVDYFGVETDAETLGMTWRIYWDFGIDDAEWRAGVKLAGA